MTATVGLEVRPDGVAVVSLQRPEALNIYNLAMRDELIDAFRAVAELPDARALLLRADGPHFSAGADLSEFASASSVFEARRIRWRRDPWLPLVDSPVPSVAALHGYCLGAGLEMALLCDLRVAAAGTVVGLPETKLGMLPSAGGSQTLARLIGPAAALPVVLGGEQLSAQEALRQGIVHELVDDVESVAAEWAGRLARLQPRVAAAARRALRSSVDLPLAEGLAAERALAADAAR